MARSEMFIVLLTVLSCHPPTVQLFGALQRGNSVTSVSGVLVKPEDVMEATTPGATLLLLDCPTLDHWRAASTHPVIMELIRDTQQQQQPGQGSVAANGSSSSSTPAAAAAGGVRKALVMVHLGSKGVIGSRAYQQWLQGELGAPWQHVIVAADDTGVGVVTRRAAQHQAKLSVVDAQVFSLKGFLEIQQGLERREKLQGGEGQGEAGRQQQENGHVGREQQQQEQQEGRDGEGMTYIAKHMSKLVLTPLKYRGWDDGDVPEALDLQQVAAEAVQGGSSAVQSALEELKVKRAEVEKQGVPKQLQGMDR